MVCATLERLSAVSLESRAHAVGPGWADRSALPVRGRDPSRIPIRQGGPGNRDPFAGRPHSAEEHFRLYFYAAVLYLRSCLDRLGVTAATVQRSPFLAGYFDERQQAAPEALTAAAVLARWEAGSPVRLPAPRVGSPSTVRRVLVGQGAAAAATAAARTVDATAVPRLGRLPPPQPDLDLRHDPLTRAGVAVTIVEDLCHASGWRTSCREAETSTQIEVVFTDALAAEGLLRGGGPRRRRRARRCV